MTKVIILRGCSGAGKSTYIKNAYNPELIREVFSADHFFMKNGEYKYDPTKIGEAHSVCMRKFLSSAHAVSLYIGDLLIVDNTNISVAEIAPYVAVASAYGLDHEIVTLDCPPERATNVHGVPPAQVKAQYKYMKMQENFFPKYWNHTIIKDYRK